MEGKARRGSPVLGVLGAFLGASLAFFLWLQLFLSGPAFLRKLLLPVCIPVGTASCLGYWFLRGWRGGKSARYFAYYVTQVSAVLAVPVVFFGTVARPVDFSQADWLSALFRNWEPLLTPEFFVPIGFFAFLALLGARAGQKRLLRYTDPAWESDPRRAAAVYAGGALYNSWPENRPVRQELPKRFWVGGKLEISGETIRTIPTLGAGRTFSVYDVAGVVVGPSTGSNVLYDYHNQVMAKFAWSMDNAYLLVQYLKDCGVPFVPYHPKSKNGRALVDSAAPETEKHTGGSS